MKPENFSLFSRNGNRPAWIARVQRSENTLLLALAIGVGLGAGVGVFVFRMGIEWFHWLFFEQVIHEWLEPVLGVGAVILSLALVGLIVGWLMHRFVGEERHHGVAGIMESIALSGGRLRYWRIPFKAVASALSIGGGASVGPEDPSVQIGSNIGSLIGQRLHVREEQVGVLVAAGGASAIAAAFKAPLAGVFFATEVLLNGSFTTGSFGVVVLAAVVSSAFTRAVEGGGAEFGALQFTLGSLAEMPLYALLGVLLAPVAALFIRAVYWQHDLWHHYLERVPRPLKTALAGVLVAVVGLVFPQIFGTGREFMTEILNEPVTEFTLVFLIGLGFAKVLMTSVSMAGGFVGGIFAPALFVGTVLGKVFGRVVNLLLPNGVSDPQAYAIAGMAALMAGVVRAPITAIMLVFELTNDYRMILPIMLASVIAVFIAERIVPQGVYAYGLARKGITLKQGRDIDVLQDLRVLDAMVTPAPSIHARRNLVELRDALREQHAHSLGVVDDAGRLVGIVTLSDLQRAYESGKTDGFVLEIATQQVITTTPDEPLWTAIRRLGQRDFGRLPVIDSETGKPIGMLSRSDIMRAYNDAITKRIETQHAEEQVRLHNLTGAHVVEYLVRPGASVANKRVQDVAWPPESTVAAIRRGERLIVPHGSTEIMLWDTITVVTDPRVEDKLQKLTGQREHG